MIHKKSHPCGWRVRLEGRFLQKCVSEVRLCPHHTNLGVPWTPLLLPHIYIPRSMTSARGGRFNRVLLTLMGHTPPCGRCMGFAPLPVSRSFWVHRPSPAGLGRPDSPPFRSDHPHSCAALLPAIPRWRRPVAQFTDLPSHRDLLGWSPDPIGIIPLAVRLLYHIQWVLSSVHQKLFSSFWRSFPRLSTWPLWR